MVVTCGELFRLLTFLVAFASLLIQVSKKEMTAHFHIRGHFRKRVRE